MIGLCRWASEVEAEGGTILATRQRAGTKGAFLGSWEKEENGRIYSFCGFERGCVESLGYTCFAARVSLPL